MPASGEDFHALAVLDGAWIEHIVSSDGPDPALQVQGWDEWVLVLKGGAHLEVAGHPVELTAGEWLLLPAGTPHRVRRTEAGTHWLAIHGVAQPAGATRGVAEPAEAALGVPEPAEAAPGVPEPAEAAPGVPEPAEAAPGVPEPAEAARDVAQPAEAPHRGAD